MRTTAMKAPPDADAIRAQARAMGFDAVRFARAETSADTRARFAAFIAEDLHGDMGWLAANAERRADPTVLWPEAKSIIMVGLNYGPATDPRATLADRGAATLSVYARNRDYHDVLKKRLKRFAAWLAQWSEVKIFVDTAPVLEKPLARPPALAGRASTPTWSRARSDPGCS